MTPTLGLARIEAYSGVPEAKADIVAQWLSLTPGWAGVCLRPSQGRPLVYLESHLDEAGYRAILRGEYDRRLLQVSNTLAWDPLAIVRWDHEMDGPQNEWRRWGGMDPELYTDVWRYVSQFLGPMFWCPTSVTERWSAYFPGDEYISHIGWDQYADKAPLRPLPQAWAKRVTACRELSGAPIVVGEFASLWGLIGRAGWLRSIEDVQGVSAACYFDVDHAESGKNWTMNGPMRRVWDAL
jgi:hypothetical protein